MDEYEEMMNLLDSLDIPEEIIEAYMEEQDSDNND